MLLLEHDLLDTEGARGWVSLLCLGRVLKDTTPCPGFHEPAECLDDGLVAGFTGSREKTVRGAMSGLWVGVVQSRGGGTHGKQRGTKNGVRDAGADDAL